MMNVAVPRSVERLSTHLEECLKIDYDVFDYGDSENELRMIISRPERCCSTVSRFVLM